MATWAQIQTATINLTNAGNISWEISSDQNETPVIYRTTYKGIIVLVWPEKIKLRYKGRSRIKVANMTTLRNAIAVFLTDNGEQADLDLLYTMLTT